MKIEATSKNTVVISLSSHDLEELGITYDDMDYKNLETRRVIYYTIRRGKQNAWQGFSSIRQNANRGYPDPFGGCVLILLYIKVMPIKRL